jgi:hypothetical protein
MENEIHQTRTGKTKNVYKIMVRKLLSKIPLLRTRKRKEKDKTNLMNHVAMAGGDGDWHNIVSNNEISYLLRR